MWASDQKEAAFGKKAREDVEQEEEVDDRKERSKRVEDEEAIQKQESKMRGRLLGLVQPQGVNVDARFPEPAGPNQTSGSIL